MYVRSVYFYTFEFHKCTTARNLITEYEHFEKKISFFVFRSNEKMAVAEIL